VSTDSSRPGEPSPGLAGRLFRGRHRNLVIAVFVVVWLLVAVVVALATASGVVWF
jgi:hypothetical protein